MKWDGEQRRDTGSRCAIAMLWPVRNFKMNSSPFVGEHYLLAHIRIMSLCIGEYLMSSIKHPWNNFQNSFDLSQYYCSYPGDCPHAGQSVFWSPLFFLFSLFSSQIRVCPCYDYASELSSPAGFIFLKISHTRHECKSANQGHLIIYEWSRSQENMKVLSNSCLP